MAQLSNQTDPQTDAYSMIPPSSKPVSAKTGPNATQKKMLGISAAAMLLGGTAWVVSNPPPPVHGDVPKVPIGPMALHPDIDAAGKVDDTMSFEQAFEVAREEVGMGGVFSWHGNWYNTFDKEEWGSLSLEQRQQFTEIIMQEHLPVKPYVTPAVETIEDKSAPVQDPTIIEGYVNGQRVMGLDFNHDGVIDTLVMNGADGYTYRVVDTTGDDGMDTLFRYDSLNGELVEYEKINEPFVLTNDQFSQGLEANMSKEVVDSILEPESTPLVSPEMSDDDAKENVDTDQDADDAAVGEEQYLADSHGPDDTYINNGDVHDMDQ